MRSHSFYDFYKGFNLDRYPFQTFTTELETGIEKDLFVKPSEYEPIVELFSNNSTMILVGNRGTGKTALVQDLLRSIDNKNCIVCLLEDFSSINLRNDIKDFYSLLIRNIVSGILELLIYQNKRIRKLSKEDRLLFSFFVNKYLPSITRRNLVRKIESIQTSKLSRAIKRTYNYCRYFLNYGATVATTVVHDIVATHLTGIPPIIEQGKIKEFFPYISEELDVDFYDTESTYSMLCDLLSLSKKLGYSRVIIVIDKLDEDLRFENDAEIIADFIKDFVSDNKLLSNSNIQIITCIWAVPFNYLSSRIRTQKYPCPEISWTKDDLINALNRRLYVFSNKKVPDFRSLFANDINPDYLKLIFILSNSNPRDLWHVFDNIFRAQYEIDCDSKILSAEAINLGLETFVRRFNFYEYYPRKANARANTMDVYSYITHLLKLSNSEFTKNELNEKAGTGGSTGNYVVGMENIGLVKKLRQESGAVIYGICDPKVIYAIDKKIKIQKE